MPAKWRNAMTQVKIPYLNAARDSLLSTNGYLFAPSYREIFRPDPPDAVKKELTIEDDPLINHYTTNPSRVKTSGDNGVAVAYWTRTRTGYDDSYLLFLIQDDGQPNMGYSESDLGLTFGFAM